MQGRRKLETEEYLKEREVKTRMAMENRSLLPRLIYLSIQSALLFRDDSEINGSAVKLESCSEFKQLLEQYAQSLGFSFGDAQRLIAGLSESKILKVELILVF